MDEKQTIIKLRKDGKSNIANTSTWNGIKKKEITGVLSQSTITTTDEKHFEQATTLIRHKEEKLKLPQSRVITILHLAKQNKDPHQQERESQVEIYRDELQQLWN